MRNVIIRQILGKRSYKTSILISAVPIIKCTITHIQKALTIYMGKKNLCIFPFTSSFKYHKASLEFSICIEHSLKLSTNAHSMPRSATKTVIPHPSKVTGTEVLLYFYAGVELPKGLKIFERKDPHGYEKALCSTAESKESNMPNLLLTTI